MTQHVVHLLEAIQIDPENGEFLRPDSRPGNRLQQLVLKLQAIGQSGQAVVLGLIGELIRDVPMLDGEYRQLRGPLEKAVIVLGERLGSRAIQVQRSRNLMPVRTQREGTDRESRGSRTGSRKARALTFAGSNGDPACWKSLENQIFYGREDLRQR